MPSFPARLAAAVLAAVAVAGPAMATPASAQTPPPGTPPDICTSLSDESPVLVEVTTLLPRAPRSGDEPFQVSGRLVNCGREPLTDVNVRLAVGEHIGTRSALALAAEEPVLGSRLPASPAAQTELAPGAGTTFDLRLTVADLGLGRRNGVYPLAVQARARTDDDGRRQPVGLASTFVPWFPEGPVSPTRLAWVMPLVDVPHRAPRELMLDDQLDRLLEDDKGRRGRLERALLAARVGARGACDQRAQRAPDEAPPPPPPPPVAPPAPCRGEAVPMTYAVDPDLVYSVEDMTRPKGYSVLVAGRAQVRPPSQNAEQWLVSLRAAAREGDVLALPFGDPDVVALSRTDSPVRDDVEQLQRLGERVTRKLLEPTRLLDDVVWPPSGPIAPAVDALADRPDTALLVDETAFEPAAASLDRTPNARTTLPSFDRVTALVSDPALSQLAVPNPGSRRWQGPRLAEQRWIAETAVIAAERPGQSRTLVVAPERRADVVVPVAVAAIADTGRLPWLCGVRLADAAAGTERCAQGESTSLVDTQGPAQAEPRGALELRQADEAPLPPAYVADLGEVRRDSDQFTEQVLIAASDSAKNTKERLLRARGRAASSAWRGAPGRGRRLLELLERDVNALRSKITLLSAPATLTGRVGTVSVTVQNALGQPVNVGVALDPLSAARLTSENAAVQVVPGDNARQVDVKVEARTSGRFTVKARLVDAAGQPFGDDVDIAVRSTQYGRAALAVTGLGAALLLVAVGVRITRRALRPARPAEASSGGDS